MARAVSPVVGLSLLVGLTVTVGTVLGLGVLAVGPPDDAPTRPIAISVTASAADGALVFRHGAGPGIDVRSISMRIEIDGEPLAYQPPVPFFAAKGFVSGPTGPFNPSADSNWTVGERASLRIAGTNRPALRPGVEVVIRIEADGRPIARLEATAA